MMGATGITRVVIFGEEYRVGGEASGAPVSDLAAYVEQKIKEVRRQGSTVDPKRLAVLASLNLADELFRERALSSAVTAAVRERAAKMDARLAAVLAGEAAGTGTP